MLKYFKRQKDKYYHLIYGQEAIASFCGQIKATTLKVKTVLDIGVALGRDLEIISSYFPGVKKYGVDIHPTNSQQLSAKGIALSLVNIEKDRVPFQDEYFDLIIINQVLEHIKEIFWVLHQMMRVLKTNGYIIIGVPNLAAIHNRLLLLLGRQPSCLAIDDAHLRGFTKPGMTKFLGIFKGLELVDYKGQNIYFCPPWLTKRLTGMLPSWAVSNFYLLRKTEEYHGEFLDYLNINIFETNYYKGE